MLCSIKHRERRLKIDTFPTRNRQIIHIGSTSVIKHCRWCGSGKETKGLLFSCFTTDRHAFSAALYLVAYFYEWSWYCNWCEAKTVFFIYPLGLLLLPCHLHRVCLTHLCQRRPEKEIWRDYELVTGKCELHDDGSSSDYEARWL